MAVSCKIAGGRLEGPVSKGIGLLSGWVGLYIKEKQRVEYPSGQDMSSSGTKKVAECRSAAGLAAAGLLLALLTAPATGLGAQQQAGLVKVDKGVEITCGESQDKWVPILTLGPIDAGQEEASLSEEIEVTLKYLFVQGSQRRRINLLVKWTLNAEVTLEINPRQLCDTRGTTGVRTTIAGQTQRPDGKAALPSGYIRILPEELD